MRSLYTKDGRPLQVSGPNVYARSGTYIGHINDGKIFDPNGRYAGTIVGDRVVHRAPDSASVRSPTMSAPRAGSGTADAARSAIWGEEPDLPD